MNDEAMIPIELIENANRFPEDFSFVLDKQEFATLRSQTVTSKSGDARGGTRYAPMAFEAKDEVCRSQSGTRTNPTWAKCLSKLKARRIRSRFISANEVQSVKLTP